MKKSVFLIFISFVLFASQSIAGDADLFEYDENEMNEEFAELNQLEQLVIESEGITLQQLRQNNNPLVANIMWKRQITFGQNIVLGGPFGIPSFLWGCVGGPLGMALVYIFTDGNSTELKHSFFGCILGAIIWGGYWYWWGPGF